MNNRGFTLIELLVSITLIIVLFTVAVPSGIKLAQNANKKQCKEVENTILSAAELYVLDNPNFVGTEVTLSDLYENNYIAEKYDFKNGYIIESGSLKKDESSVSDFSITVSSTEGYKEYSFSIPICD